MNLSLAIVTTSTKFTILFPVINNAYTNTDAKIAEATGVPEKLKPILKQINDNLDQDLSLKALSERYFISISTLCSSFKSTTGVSLHEYITFRRIAKAKELLLKGYSVSETCSRCGFNDYAHFIRAFKKSTGLSPGKYKK